MITPEPPEGAEESETVFEWRNEDDVAIVELSGRFEKFVPFFIF